MAINKILHWPTTILRRKKEKEEERKKKKKKKKRFIHLFYTKLYGD